MMTIIFIVAVITGLVVAIDFWRMRNKIRNHGSFIEKSSVLGENGIIATKEYFLMKGIIKYQKTNPISSEMQKS